MASQADLATAPTTPCPWTTVPSSDTCVIRPGHQKTSVYLRRQVSRKAAQRGLVLAKSDEDNEPINLDDFVSEKSQEERDRILETIVGSFIFQHTNEDQVGGSVHPDSASCSLPPPHPPLNLYKKQTLCAVDGSHLQKTVIVDAMQRVDVKAGDRVIKQGDAGDRFYVVTCCAMLCNAFF